MKIYLAAWLMASILTFSSPVSADDLRLTPSHVYSTWSNLNDCLLAIGQEQALDETLQAQLALMRPTTFSGKRPVDVLGEVRGVQDKLNRFRVKRDLAPVAQISEDYKRVTPRDVYLNSGRVLDGLLETLILMSEPERQISPFYEHHRYDDKTPNDVFGLVDLANRRLDIILSAGDPL